MIPRPAVVDRALLALSPTERAIAISVVNDFMLGVGEGARDFYVGNEAALARVWSAAIEMARIHGQVTPGGAGQ